MNNPLKQGLTYISKETGQLRYSVENSKEPNQSEYTYDNEKWLQPVSMYKAAQQIQAGRPVSIALLDELIEPFKSDEESYVVLTNSKRHKKCIGIAMNPAQPGEIVHILSSGTYKFDLTNIRKFPKAEYDENINKLVLSDKEIDQTYKPNFVLNDNASYKNLIGKTIYLDSLNIDSDDPWWCIERRTSLKNGILTINEKEAYASYGNVVQIGHITDFGEDELVIEVDLEGDGRGPIDFTQYSITIDDPLIFKSDNQIRVLAIGSRLPENFKYTFRMGANKDAQILDTDFIAIQDFSEKTNTVHLFPLKELNRNFDAYLNVPDRSFLKAFVLANEIVDADKDLLQIHDYLIDFKPEGTSQAATKLYKALEKFLGNVKKSDITITPSTDELIEDYVQFTVTSIGSGPYQVYISNNLLRNFFGGSHLIEQTLNQNLESHDVNGKLVLADIRYGFNQNILGVYASGIYDKQLNTGFEIIATRYGEFKIDSSMQSQDNMLVPGDVYYLGENGTITNNPNVSLTYRVKIGFAKDYETLIVAPGEIQTTGPEKVYVGAIKPATYTLVGDELKLEFGYLIMDGVTRHSKTTYAELYDILESWGWELNEDETSFIIPAMQSSTSQTKLMIRYLNDYKVIPNNYNLTLNFTGQFVESRNKNSVCRVTRKTGIINITPLLKDGPKFVDYQLTDNFDVALSNLHIRLFVDIGENEPDWVEVPEGFFIHNNTTLYGYRWKCNFDPNTGIYSLDSITHNGFGIAYKETPFSPPLLLNGKRWKLSVVKANYWQQQFDINRLLQNSVVDIIDDSSDLPVSGKAVAQYANNFLTDIENLSVLKTLTLGSLKDKADNFAVYLPSDKFATFYGGMLINTGVSIIKTNNRGFLTYSSAKQWWADSKIINLTELEILDKIINEPEVFNETKHENAHDLELIPFVALLDHVKLKTSLLDVLYQDVAPHGLIQGIDGTINAAKLGGIKLSEHSKKQLYNDKNGLNRDFETNKSYIPFFHEGHIGFENNFTIYDYDSQQKIYDLVIQNSQKPFVIPALINIPGGFWLKHFEYGSIILAMSSYSADEWQKVINSLDDEAFLEKIQNKYLLPINYFLTKDFDRSTAQFSLHMNSFDEDIDFRNIEIPPTVIAGSELFHGTFTVNINETINRNFIFKNGILYITYQEKNSLNELTDIDQINDYKYTQSGNTVYIEGFTSTQTIENEDEESEPKQYEIGTFKIHSLNNDLAFEFLNDFNDYKKDKIYSVTKIKNNLLGEFTVEEIATDFLHKISLTNNKFIIYPKGYTNATIGNRHIYDAIQINNSVLLTHGNDAKGLVQFVQDANQNFYKIKFIKMPEALSLDHVDLNYFNGNEISISKIKSLTEPFQVILHNLRDTFIRVAKNTITFTFNFEEFDDDFVFRYKIFFNDVTWRRDFIGEKSIYDFIIFPEPIQSAPVQTRLRKNEHLTFTNIEQVPQTVGGIKQGVSFAEPVSLQQMWNNLLYPYVGPTMTFTLIPDDHVFARTDTINISTFNIGYIRHSELISEYFIRRNDTNAIIQHHKFHTPQESHTWQYTLPISIPIKNDFSFKLTLVTPTNKIFEKDLHLKFIDACFFGSCVNNSGEYEINFTNDKRIVHPKANLTVTYHWNEDGIGGNYWFASPADWGPVQKFVDQNGFNLVNAFAEETRVHNDIEYNVYILKDFNILDSYRITYKFKD